MKRATSTSNPEFNDVRHLLSDKPLRRPSASQLKRIAKENPPPREWFDVEEECPFDVRETA